MNEIEEFLRRAAAMRAQQAQQAKQAQQQERRQAESVSRVPPAVRMARPAEPVMDAEVVEVEEVTGDDVARDVARNLDTRAFTARASSLAERIRNADDVMEAHMHQVFEHKLGQLGSVTSAVADSTLDDEELAAKAAAREALTPLDIHTLFSSPQHIRQAILLSEVLNPPQHRW